MSRPQSRRIIAVVVVSTGLLIAAGTLMLRRGQGDEPTESPRAEYPILAIGATAPPFSLPGVDGKTHELAEYSASRALAVFFTCNHCPVSQLYEGRIGQLYRDYKDKGVAVIAINPNSSNSLRLDEQGYTDVSDSLADMKVRAESGHLEYPYLYDGDTQGVSIGYGPVATPHVFVFDQDRKLRYQGRPDDNLQESLVTSQYARDAIDAVLAGRPVATTTTAVLGCSTKWLRKSEDVVKELAAIEAEPVELSMANAPDLAKLRDNPTGKLLLVNFWATWCGPCASEFPDLQDTYRMYRHRGLEMVTVSENVPEERAGVLKFLQKFHASSPNFLFGTSDTAGLQEAFDHNLGAAVPFTLVIADNGDVVYQEQGSITTLDLRRAILANLPDTPKYPGQRAYWSAARAASEASPQ